MFRDLARKKRQISNEECIEILKNEPRGVLSVIGDEGYPYGMPINFWYCEEDGHIYFHGGKTGHKIDAIRKCDKVSFCVYDKGYKKHGDWALNIKSVVIFGRIKEVEDYNKMLYVSRKLSCKFTCDTSFIENEIEKYAHETLCLELIPEFMTGKRVREA